MPQHFLLSKAARSLRLAKVARMADEEGFEAFRMIRWAATEGEAVCPHCACSATNRYKARKIWKCKACFRQFSVTSGTIFASRKLPIVTYLLAIAIFVNGAKGHSALQMSRDLDCQYKSAYVMCHKIREAMAVETAETTLEGEVEVDGAYFGGHVRPANHKENRVDRRKAENQTGKRRVVVIMRQRGGMTLPFVFKREGQSIATIGKRVAPDALVYADEAAGSDVLHTRFLTKLASITSSLIRWTMPAPIRLRAFSAAYVALRLARTITLRAATYTPTRMRWRGARITAAFRMAGSISR